MHACTWFAADKPFIKRRCYVTLCYVTCRENELHKSMASLQRLTDATESIYECLLRLQKSLAEDEPLYGDLQTVQVLTNEHRVRLSLSLSLSLFIVAVIV